MRRLSLLLLVLVASSALASTPIDQKPLADGFVQSVNVFSRTITIHGGRLTIDASAAEFRDGSFESITPGSHIAVVFREGTYVEGQAIPATVVQILRQPVGSMTGEVESVDAAANTFRVLGHTIRVTGQTLFHGAIPSLDPRNAGELPVGHDVHVELAGEPTALVAHRIYTIAPIADQRIVFSGIIREMTDKVWTLMRSEHTTVHIVSTTAIQGTPRVGKLVQIMARIDDGVVTAQLVEERQMRCPAVTPNPTFTIRGAVIALDDTSITFDNGTAVLRARLDGDTLYDEGRVAVGDNVNVQMEKIGTDFLARMITKINANMTMVFLGRLLETGATEWVVETSTSNTPGDGPYVQTRRIRMTETTRIHNNPAIGDKVILTVDRTPAGELIALAVDRDPHQ